MDINNLLNHCKDLHIFQFPYTMMNHTLNPYKIYFHLYIYNFNLQINNHIIYRCLLIHHIQSNLFIIDLQNLFGKKLVNNKKGIIKAIYILILYSCYSYIIFTYVISRTRLMIL